ncbi:hypothetical protein GLOIN_2v1699956 [Rhizophagus irregularis DAOM 181602=DAOM 197198]|nr:hypothetical protein GLOIN_2v1699956 [Rhizophagus irregularis DAOM 181602=DAOM 197198]
MTRKRSLSKSSNQSYPTSSRIGRLVACNCSECNGRLVDPRTKTIHEINQDSEDDDSERTEVHLPDEAELLNDEPYESASISDEPRMRESEAELPSDEPYESASISDEPRMRESEAELPSRQRSRKYVRPVIIAELGDTVDDKSSESSEYTTIRKLYSAKSCASLHIIIFRKLPDPPQVCVSIIFCNFLKYFEILRYAKLRNFTICNIP